MAMSSSSVRIREFQFRDPGSNPGIVTIKALSWILNNKLPPALNLGVLEICGSVICG